jgi:hypothetical protein
MTTRQRPNGLIAAALCTLCTATLSAQPAPTPPAPQASAAAEAEALENQSNQLRQQQRPAEALVLLRRAYDLAHLPRTLARLALAETALGMWIAAESHLAEALGAASDPWIQQNRAALQATMNTIVGHLARVEIFCEAPNAEVWMEGRRASALPLAAPLRVVAGTTPIEVRAQGFHTVVRQVTVDATQIVRETVVLTPVAATAPSPSQPVVDAAPVNVPVRVPVVSRAAPVAPARAGGGWRGSVGYGLLAGSGVGLVVGVVGLILRDGYVQRFNEDPSCGARTLNGAGPCQESSDGVDSSTAIAAAGFTLGGLLAAGGAVLLLTRPSSSGSTATVRVSSGPGDLGLGLAGSF